MTFRELSQLYWLRREIIQDELRLAQMRQHGEETKGQQAIVVQKHQRIVDEAVKLEEYIAGIDDSYIRQLMTWRFCEGMTWDAVAYKVGGGNTKNGVRMQCKRYLEHDKEKGG